jgi:DNA-binding Xre family transcriptional regulator
MEKYNLMLHQYFKQTMDTLGIKGKALAKKAGCSSNNISEIRNGKVNPPINRFWELVELCEELAPGFRKEFARKVAGGETFFLSNSKVNSNLINNQSFVYQVNGEAESFSEQLKMIPQPILQQILQAIVLNLTVDNSQSQN